MKEFYTAAFPNWTWKNDGEPTTSTHGLKVYMWEVTNHKGLGGGIVQMPEDCSPGAQEQGRGFTVYYFVDKLEDVCSPLLACRAATDNKLTRPKQQSISSAGKPPWERLQRASVVSL
jgi:hypothetical protein